MSDFTIQWKINAYKIILDATALFSACLSSKGASRELYRLAGEGRVILILCDYTIEEVRINLQEAGYHSALYWFDLSLSNQHYLHVPNPSLYDVMNNLSLIPDDPKDIPYLILAKENNADFIVSFDHHLLDLRQYTYNDHDIPIIKAGECLKFIR